MIAIDDNLKPADLLPALDRFWDLSAQKIRLLDEAWEADGTPVFTVNGIYTARGWTEWTQGFVIGGAILQFDATGESEFLDKGIEQTVEDMSDHVTHMGVHDHGFNNVSTYGNLWRLLREERIPDTAAELAICEFALRYSGAVQARRWTRTADGGGFIYSFNGPQSLFADTIRSLRSLALAFQLGQTLLDEQDAQVNLLDRLLLHAWSTAKYTVYYGADRDIYDVRGRVAHESLFNPNNGSYRCPSTQQGYSPFSTWTRALAWIMLGFAEQLEWIDNLYESYDVDAAVPLPVEDPAWPEENRPYWWLAAAEHQRSGRKLQAVETFLRAAATAACDFYLENTPLDGVPYWDTGAPGLVHMGDYLDRPAEPFNRYEPVDSSAAAIAAQGLVRLGRYLQRGGEPDGDRYLQAGLTTARTLLSDSYLSIAPKHQGLLLHSVYHRPNGWDYIPDGQAVPCGESSQWGDYHLRELALTLQRIALGDRHYTFFGV